MDFNYIAGQCSQVSTLVIRSNRDALIDSLDLSHLEVLEEDFLLDVVDIPDADSVVMDGDEVLVGVVVEGNFIGNVHTNRVATNGFSRFGLNLKVR